MKKLLLTTVAFVFLFGAEFHPSKNSQNKFHGVYFSARSNLCSPENITSLSSSTEDDTDKLDMEHQEHFVGYFPETVTKRFIAPRPREHTLTQIHPFIFDLPPPRCTCVIG